MKSSGKTNDELQLEIKLLKEQLASKVIIEPIRLDLYSLYNSILKSSRQGVIIILDDQVVFVSGLIDDLFGVSAEQLIDCDVERLFKHIDPLYQNKVRKAYHKYKGKDQFKFNYDFRITDKNGQSRWLEINSLSIMFREKQSILGLFLDITNRKTAEIALHESRQRLELSLESAGLAAWDHNFETGEVIRSRLWSQMLGYSEEEIGALLEDWKKLIHPDDLSNVLESTRKHESGEKAEFDVEHRMKTKTGEWKWIRNWGKIVRRDAGGKPLRALGTHMDISTLKEIEKIRGNSQKLLKDIINSTELDIIIRDKNAKILYAGKRFVCRYGYTEKDIVGLNNLIIWRRNGRSKEQIKKWLDEDQLVLATGQTLDYMEEIDYEDDITICYRTIKKRILTPSGIQAVLVSYEDITKRKKAEEALQKNERRFRLMAESIEDVFWMAVPDGSKYIYVSPVIENIWQRPHSSFIENPKYFLDAVHPDDRQIYESVLEKYHRVGRSYKNEYRIIRKDGSVRWILDRAFPVTNTDNVVEFMAGVFSDITERKRAEKELRGSEERFRNLVETMNDGLLVVDNQLSITYMNEKMSEILKAKVGSLIGKDVKNYLDSSNSQILKNHWEKRKKGGKISYELTWRATDNTNVVTIISPKPLWNSNNEFWGSFSVVTDITERKQDELINKSKSSLADKLRSSDQVNECLEAGCRAVTEAELLKHSAFVLIDCENKITHLDYLRLHDKELITFKKEFPEIINRLNEKPGDYSIISKSYLTPNGNIDKFERVITPIADQIVEHTGWLIADTIFPGKKIDSKTVQFIEDIAVFVAKRTNEILFLSHLKHERQQLEDKNIALREVLTSIEKEKIEIRQTIAKRIDQMVIPTLNRIINNDGTVNHTYYDLLISTIKELAASSGGLMHLYTKLSPREVEICNLIKGGSSSKEIAVTLHLSLATIQKHRERIRNKLALVNKDINLASFLKNTSEAAIA